MKRKIVLLMILIFSMERITGCQYTKKEAENVNIQKEESRKNKEESIGEKNGTSKKEETEIKTGDETSKAEESGTENQTSKVESSSETTTFWQDRQETEEVQNNETTKTYEPTYGFTEESRKELNTYGFVEESRKEFFDEENGGMSYYYKMERFFVNDSFANAALVNNTLKQIYDKYEENYLQASEIHSSGVHNIAAPYSYWHILWINYVGDDYISITYNDVYYMGGAHPYSRFDGITIDCRTGEEVFAPHFLQKSDEEILIEVSSKMGFDQIVASWDKIDFCLKDDSIVFFYRFPGFWDDVAIQREDF